jgi:hypothetical protein
MALALQPVAGLLLTAVGAQPNLPAMMPISSSCKTYQQQKHTKHTLLVCLKRQLLQCSCTMCNTAQHVVQNTSAKSFQAYARDSCHQLRQWQCCCCEQVVAAAVGRWLLLLMSLFLRPSP